MKLLVIGSRSVADFDLAPYIDDSVDLIISGGASGIDTLAEAFADKHKISKLIIYPQYKKYGRAAPIKRNHQMVDFADCVLAVWDGFSRGTADTIQYAKKQHKGITVLQVKKDEA
ncbi:MAG: hypothetical protein IJC99_06790 [Clostridia bacterium]|nr:hypothetical protein [Clostridia bacterium]